MNKALSTAIELGYGEETLAQIRQHFADEAQELQDRERGRGGGRRKARRESAQSQFDSLFSQAHYGSMTASAFDLVEQFSELRDEMTKLGMDTSQLNEMFELLGDQILKDFGDTLDDVLNPVHDILDPLHDLQDQFNDAKAAAEALGRNTEAMTTRFLMAESLMKERLASQTMSEGRSLLAGLLEATGKSKEATLLRWQLQKAEYRLAIDEFKSKVLLLEAEGIVLEGAAELIAALEEAYEDFVALGPDFGDIVIGAGNAFSQSVREAGETANDNMLAFIRRLQEELMGASGNPIDEILAGTQALRNEFWDLMEEKTTALSAILAQAGVTPADIDAAGGAVAYVLNMIDQIEGLRLDAFFKDLFDPLLNFGKQAALGGNSPLTPIQRLQEAQRQFEETLARAKEGDIDAIRQLPQMGDQLLSIGGDFFSTATAGFQSLFDFVTGEVEGVGQSGPEILLEAQMQASEQNHSDLMMIAEILQAMQAQTASTSKAIVRNQARGAGAAAVN